MQEEFAAIDLEERNQRACGVCFFSWGHTSLTVLRLASSVTGAREVWYSREESGRICGGPSQPRVLWRARGAIFCFVRKQQ